MCTSYAVTTIRRPIIALETATFSLKGSLSMQNLTSFFRAKTMTVLVLLLAAFSIGVRCDLLGEDGVSLTPQFKFNPGLWLMSARKRNAYDAHSPHISVGVLSNMKKFFDDVREDIEMRTRSSDEYDMVADSPAKNEVPEYQTRAKNRGTRKGSLNPSLLWKGLGRK